MKRARDAEDAKGKAESSKDTDAFAIDDSVYIYSPCTMSLVNEERMNEAVHAVVPGQYLVAPHKQRTLRLRQLWGTDVYTDDSDLLAVLVHTGHVSIQEESEAAKPPLLVSIQVCARQSSYASTTRHGLCSRAFGTGHSGVSYKITRCAAFAGDPAELEPRLSSAAAGRRCLPSVALLPPGYPPSAHHVMFNLSNEPMFKYALPLVADRGLEPSEWTSTRLRTEALYLESETRRYELKQKGTDGGKSGGIEYDTYQLAEVLSPQQLDADATKKAGVPLPDEHVRVLHAGLDWEAIAWGRSSVRIGNAEYPLLRMQFVSHTKAQGA
mmetsp:Transcript_1480/g.4303  ORF Transcript_1480/g.4303 Transcript_1480/m.4303 type:complete len:325 (+) Transcript_1480:51-1025(+)|eukprot:CAMPEP_0206045478 /NCGR_PEP_ID=MMETSP1466-20131121/16034_1 /ASSEMBLY_ACC=CAM_ASM_001126 /TAXON_ID=44452 /ORGANISM="Pavlova gyrans, Strain CCMP608" /LENGTH=324 /DNA_ID=CAMNT_0053420417 /DNA_START=1 /DNA_END=975 /DNA_ORIENTATION=+